MENDRFKYDVSSKLDKVVESVAETARRIGTAESGNVQTIYWKVHYSNQHIESIRSSVNQIRAAVIISTGAILAYVIHVW